MKRLVVCCDGTWNQLTCYPTNVVKVAQTICPFDANNVPQVVYYQEGLGTRWYDRLPGGAFGWGIDYNIQSAYQFLCMNYQPGDEIYLFGFSRGAYTVRSLAGLIYCSGLLKPQHIGQIERAYQIYRDPAIRPGSRQAIDFRAAYAISAQGETQIPIALLGCWDTVGSLGIPNLTPLLPIDAWINRKYRFHDMQLNRKIQVALHAVAVDERRTVFAATPMQKSPKNPQQVLKQVWFPGGHGCVGGGTAQNLKLSNQALIWMLESVTQAGLGLAYDFARLPEPLAVDPLIDFYAPFNLFERLGRRDRPIQDEFTALHASTCQRWQHRLDYRPANLRPFAAFLDALQRHRDVVDPTP